MADGQFENEGQQPPTYQANGNAGQQLPTHQAQQSTSGLAVAGLVLGILAILGAFVPLLNIGAIPFALVGLALAIAGFVGIRNGKHSGRGIAIAGIVLGAVALIVICGMYGCAGAVASSAGSSPGASTASSSAVSSASSSSSTSANAALSSTRTTLGPLSLNLPEGWVKGDETNGPTYYYPSSGEQKSFIGIGARSADLSDGKSERDALEESAISMVNSIGDFNITENHDTTVSSYTAKRVVAKPADGKTEASFQICSIYVPDRIISVMGFAFGDKYESVISSCLDSIEISGNVSAQSSDPQNSQAESNAEAVSEVSPDLKDALDSYEAFMDEYIAFMERYNSSDDTASMMADYLNYLQKYSDFMAKVDAIDTDSMSAADYAYYIEVTSRVSQKLLSVL